MWLSLMLTSIFGVFAWGHSKAFNDRTTHEPDPITGQLRAIQESLRTIDDRVSSMER